MAKSKVGQGIRWSAPVVVRAESAGLIVTLPERVVGALGLGAGDVLNFTELPDGAIEVWMVKKSTYASLADMAAKPAAKGKADRGTKKRGRKA